MKFVLTLFLIQYNVLQMPNVKTIAFKKRIKNITQNYEHYLIIATDKDSQGFIDMSGANKGFMALNPIKDHQELGKVVAAMNLNPSINGQLKKTFQYLAAVCEAAESIQNQKDDKPK